MGSSYEGAIRRLTEYRRMLGLTQEKMSEVVNLTQSHYSKLERGTKIISNDVLSKLMKNACDVDYLITGVETKRTILDEMFSRCPEESKADLLELMVWAVNQGLNVESIKKNNEQIDFEKEIDILKYNIKNNKDTIWQHIRKTNKLTQEKMADMLDINIKRYRNIEKEKIKPDADILSTLYEELGYQPTLIMKSDKNYLMSLNQIWNQLPKDLQDEISKYIEEGISLINYVKEYN